MCIRDSDVSGGTRHSLAPARRHRHRGQRAGPVSYTHLSNYMEAAAEWPGKLVDPEGLKVYMPEEDVEREGVFEGQINTFKACLLYTSRCV